MPNGLLRSSTSDSHQHFVTASTWSRGGCLECDREEAFSVLANGDGSAAKISYIFQAIFDFDVKNLGCTGVVNHKHHQSTSPGGYCVLVSGVKDSDQGMARMDCAVRDAFEAVTLFGHPFQLQLKPCWWRWKGRWEMSATWSVRSHSCCS